MRILSFGGGVNSTALLVLAIQGKIDVDAVVFSDTKCEMPETYEHIKTVEKLCKKHNLQFYTLSGNDLFEDYFNKEIIPFRAFRSCTDRYKIRPMHKFVKEKFGEDVTWIIGFDYDERHRGEKFQFYGSRFEFPLIDMEVGREGCKQIIKDFGLDVPVKSGCWFCPFTKKAGWIWLYKNHPELFEKAKQFEENCRKYPEATLTNKPLAELEPLIKQYLQAEKEQTSMCNWLEEKDGEPCIFCHQ